MISSKHCKHPSIVKIRGNISNDLVFNFQCVNAHDISKIIKVSMVRKSMDTTWSLSNYYKSRRRIFHLKYQDELITPY